MTNNLTAIILDYNKGFKWITKGNIHIKGYFMGGGYYRLCESMLVRGVRCLRRATLWLF